jgi:hypothetical protein
MPTSGRKPLRLCLLALGSPAGLWDVALCQLNSSPWPSSLRVRPLAAVLGQEGKGEEGWGKKPQAKQAPTVHNHWQPLRRRPLAGCTQAKTRSVVGGGLRGGWVGDGNLPSQLAYPPLRILCLMHCGLEGVKGQASDGAGSELTKWAPETP